MPTIGDQGRPGRSTRPASGWPTSSSTPTAWSPPSGPTCPATARSTRPGCVVSPGLVDLHTHLRQPGQEEAETIETGARAAALGGYTCILAMPNTIPADRPRRDRPRGARARPRRAPVRRPHLRRHHRGAGRRAAGPPRRDGRARRALLHRRRRRRGRRPPDAPRPRVRRRRSARGSSWPSTARTRCWPRAGTCTRASGRPVSGIPGQPAEAEELMVMRDLALARLTGTRVHFQHLSTARLGRDGAGRQGRRAARHLRGHHAPLHAHPRRVRVVRPRVQGQPAAAHRRRRRRRPRRPGRRHHRLHRHRPRPAHPGGEGGGVRPGAAGHARPRDGAGPRAHRARPPHRPRCWRCCPGGPRRSSGSTTSTACRWRWARPANLTVIDPERHLGRRPERARQPQPQHALRRPRRSRGQVRHTLLRGEPVVLDGEAQR